MGFATEASTEWKMGGGHSLQPHSLGTWDKCPYPHTHPKFRPDYRRSNIYKPGSHSQPCLCPTASFSFTRVVMWVICCHISNLSQLGITVYSRYHIMRDFFRALTASSGGGGGGGTCPPGPPLGPALVVRKEHRKK